jgi:hypothetical protein
MKSSKWSTYYQVLQGFINTAVVVLVIYFMFFAFQGERYTALDGKVERTQRIVGDKLLEERITKLENKN